MTLQLEVGRTYLNREGEKVKIVSMRAATAYRYEGDDGCHYTAEGRFDVDAPGHGFDLVAECGADVPAPEAPKPLPLCEAILAEVTAEAEKLEPGMYQAGVAYGLGLALGILHKHFAALSVEKVARMVCEADVTAPSADSPILMGMRTAKAWEARMPQAQAVMKLLRKE